MAFDLEKQALIASGINEERMIRDYSDKLQALCDRFMGHVIHCRDPLTRARKLFNWLWAEKPSRYQLHGNYKLHEVIDNQVHKKKKQVGNCLGLTLLYNSLLQRMGITPKALYLEHAFGIGPHVLTILQTGESTIDIENILPGGFDYKGHFHNLSRVIWNEKELVADVYHSLGNQFFEKGKFPEALNQYKSALALNPRYEKARLNIAIVSDRIKAEGTGNA